MAMMALIFSGLASIPRLLTVNLSSFPEGTPKTHLVGLSFQTSSLVYPLEAQPNQVLLWSVEGPEAIEGFFQVKYKLILGLGFDNDVINIGFNIAM